MLGHRSRRQFGDKLVQSLKGHLKEVGFCLRTFCSKDVLKKFSCLIILTLLFVCAFFSFRIKHENIVALEDIYESPNHLYLVMQL